MKNKICGETYRLHVDMLTILLWTISTIIFIITPIFKDNIIRTILGVPLVIFIPGYILTTALFPKENDLDLIERISLSFGLSIAIVPLLGLILNYTFGIRLIPILITICIYIIILVVITEYNRRGLSQDKQFLIQINEIFDHINNDKPKNRVNSILTTIFIFTIIIAIFATIYVITVPNIGEKFTEFYILDHSGKTDSYPTELKLGSSATLLAGVVNHEYTPVNYTIQLILDNNILTTKKLMLNHNERWEQNITFSPEREGNDMRLELFLFKENNFTSRYRELHIWANVTI